MSLIIPVVSTCVAGPVFVNQSGPSGSTNFTSIMAAVTSGATNIIITDSAQYFENVQIGDPTLLVGGPPVTLTATQVGANRPVITGMNLTGYIDSKRGNQYAGFGLFANNSVVANLVIEAYPDAGGGQGAMMVMATNALIENCLFRIATNTFTTLNSANPLLFFGQQGDGSGSTKPGANPTPGGPDCNGCIVRNCEFMGVAKDASPLEPNGTSKGYLGQKIDGTSSGQGSGFIRMDHNSDGRNVTVTCEGCYFHHNLDYGIFPTDNTTPAGGVGISPITMVVKKCRFDAEGKFQIRGRGVNFIVQDSIFTRSCQNLAGDSEAAAVSSSNNSGNEPTESVVNCLFVNCGSAQWGEGYSGGVNNHNSPNFTTVDRCTFVDCLNGVSAGSGSGGNDNPPQHAMLSVSNSIFHQIGDNVPPAVSAGMDTLTNGSPLLVDGLYPAWTAGMPRFLTGGNNPPDIWSAVFNMYNDVQAPNPQAGQMIINNCMVGSIASEDTQPWAQAITNVIGSRLYAGDSVNGTNFVLVGTTPVIRATPVFVNQDANALNPFKLASTSPGQGLGANLAPVLEPTLAAKKVGNQVTISWTQPIWVSGYVLASTPSLTSPVWTPVSGVVDMGGGSYSVPVTIAAGNQYFAVRQAL